MQLNQDDVPYRHLEIVLKTVERCNINCTYCYFFNGGDVSYKFHPPYIENKTIYDVAEFLLKGCKDLFLESLHIIFHGGEPLMQKKENFDAMCSHFRSVLNNHVKLSFGIQTNGMLIDQEWIDLFEKHQIGVGVSLDGPKMYNDLLRIDHRKRGTYDRVVNGLNKLRKAHETGNLSKVGLICVINPNHNARKIYRHFVDDLKIYGMNFLLPDFTHDTFNEEVNKYGKYLCDLFDEWVKDDNEKIRITFIKSIFFMLNRNLSSQKQHNYSSDDRAVIVISSNGNIVPDDVLRLTPIWGLADEINVKDISLYEYFKSPIFRKLLLEKNQVPEKCNNCCWENICKGGMLLHRYSRENGFNNKSIYCESLKELYSKLTSYLLSHGFPVSIIYNALNINYA